jgi:hypothetical protein
MMSMIQDANLHESNKIRGRITIFEKKAMGREPQMGRQNRLADDDGCIDGLNPASQLRLHAHTDFRFKLK